MPEPGQEVLPVVIVGMSCRLPGASNLDEFWQLIVSGGDATGELPADVLDRELYYDPRQGVRGKAYSTTGGVVPRLPFDNEKCRLSPELLRCCDSTQLIACEVAYDALRDAAYDPHCLPAQRSGVFFGHTCGSNKGGDIVYSVYIEQVTRLLCDVHCLSNLTSSEIDAIARSITDEVRQRCDHRVKAPGLDTSASNLAQLIAHAFGLDGPSLVVDAACASSLQALALGARALQLGEIDMAVVGGASHCKSDSLVLFSAAQSVSAGESCPFDDRANGLVTAEGYVALILKTLPKALADGDRIRGVIRGIGMSADGRGKSLWAPRKEGQIIAVRRAYPESLQPADVQYLEAHATSTQMGDATELAALATAFPEKLPGGRRIPLGSVKGNIGHTLETAGVASLVKVVLAMEHGIIPPVANLQQPNSTIPWDRTPFYLPTVAEDWNRPADGSPRRAAVNAFGIGGLNVHLLLEEYLPAAANATADVAPSRDVSATVKEPVAVIGMGAILPGVGNVEAFWDLLVSGRDPKTEVTPDRWDPQLLFDPTERRPYTSRSKRGGFVTDYCYNWRRHKIPPKQVATANPLQFMLLDATEQALEQAGYLKRTDFDRERVGVIVGTTFGGDFANQLQAGLRLPEFGRSLRQRLRAKGMTDSRIDEVVVEYDAILLAKMPALIDETGSFTSSTLASRITKTFDLKGGALALDAGIGSGLVAIGACIDALRTRACDMMICAVGQRNMDLVAFESLTRLDALAKGGQGSVFARQAEGYLPGEGCGVLLLKRLSDAQRDGDTILAVLHGVAASTNWAQKGAAIGCAAERALCTAGAAPQDLVCFETLSILPQIARAELEQFGQLLASTPRQCPATFSSLVPQFGYMGAAHAMAATMKAILSVSREQLPTGMVLADPHPIFISSPHLRLQQTARTLDSAAASGIGISCGTDEGPAYHLIVEPAARAVARHQTQSSARTLAKLTTSHWSIVRVGAGSWELLRQHLDETPLDQLYQLSNRFTPSDRSRLAIVCQSADDFAAKCRQATSKIFDHSKLTRERLAASGIYLGEPASSASSPAFLFPGQGSQYPGMLTLLIEELPEARQACRMADAAMAALGFESFREITEVHSEDLGRDVWKTQVSMLLADFIIQESLVRLGLSPSIVAGHSFGEYAALVCAGAWSLTDAIRATRHRYQSIIESNTTDGGMAATDAPRDKVERLLAGRFEGAYIANLNAPDQTVVSGHRVVVERVVEQLKQLGFTALMIKVPCPFHTPLMAPTASCFSERLADIPLRDSDIPVISTATGRAMTRRAQIRESLVGQLTMPVNYSEILRTLLDTHPTLVIETGPRQTLTQLCKRNYPDHDILFLSCDVVRRPGAATLLGVIAQADCLGPLDRQYHDHALAPEQHVAGTGRVLQFDATEKRTTKMREAARSGGTAEGIRNRNPGEGSRSIPPAVTRSTLKHPADSFAGRHIADTAVRRSVPTEEQAEVSAFQGHSVSDLAAQRVTALSESRPAATRQVAAATTTIAPSTELSRQKLQRILVAFVVEQTGYPEDIVELDADLEADLGIDSIKKAQLFGEVGERFAITPRGTLSLDDFPTLRHVYSFLLEELGDRVRDSAGDSESDRSLPGVVSATVLSPPVSSTSLPVLPVPHTEATAAVPDETELRRILVGFVIEQTGYPEDIIEFDADLEADLGIDSIKKAQLFGEVGERFHIVPRQDMSLDDFSTLDHVIGFLMQELGTSPESRILQAGSSRPETTTLRPMDLPVVATSALSGPQRPPASPMELVFVPSDDEVRQILIDFVIEQTGYPKDIIEFDADLEADLGIDSIKKAQLFGEVGERFHIAPREDLSLDDFPTLGHVLQFLLDELSGGSGHDRHSETSSKSAPAKLGAPTGPTGQRSAAEQPVRHTAPQVSTVQPTWNGAFCHVQVLEGTPGDIGRQHGNLLKHTIQREIASLVEGPSNGHGTTPLAWPAPWLEEIDSIAAAAEINRSAVVLWNLRADSLMSLRTTFDPTTCESLPPMRRETVTLVQIRRTDGGVDYLTIGRPGRVSAAAGANATGLAVSWEPLDAYSPAKDIVSVAAWTHTTLAAARTVEELRERLASLSLAGRWSLGVSSNEPAGCGYWIFESGEMHRVDSAASPEQTLFHASRMNDPHTLVLTDRQSGAQERIELRDLLRAPATRMRAASVERAKSAAPTVMKRHVLRMTPAARPPGRARTYRDSDLIGIVGGSGLGVALRDQLSQLGCRVELFAEGDFLARFTQQLLREVPRHMVFLTESSNVVERLDDIVIADEFATVFEVCRRWIEILEQTNRLSGSTVAAVTRLGGDFGFHSTVPRFTGGGIIGLLKGVRREYPSLRVKSLDFGTRADVQTIAREFVLEMDSLSPELEVGIHAGQRYVVQAVAASAQPVAGVEITRGGVWVVSGGGRGVTSAVAREFGQRFGLRLHLLGTTSRPDEETAWRHLNEDQLRELKRQIAIETRQQGKSPADALRKLENAMELDRNLQRYRAAGVQATYHVCDLSDRACLSVILDKIRNADGSIEGILHGAGVEAACRFVRKRADSVRATIASKCDGAVNLIALTRNDPLRYFVGFGSTSGRFGGLGQTDYSLASDLLAKITDRLAAERPECMSLCFHWPPWDEVGMAVRPESKVALEHAGLTFMPVSEGVEHVVAELGMADREREILILDKPGLLDTDGTMNRATAPADPAVFYEDASVTDAAQWLACAATPPAAAANPPHRAVTDCSRTPLIDKIQPSSAAGQFVADVHLDASRDPFLVHHRLRGRPFLPVVISMEMFAEAASLLRPTETVVGLRDVQLVSGWTIDPQFNVAGRIWLREEEDGIHCELRGAVFSSRHEVIEESRLFASAVVEFGAGPPSIQAIDPGTPLLDWYPFVYPSDGFLIFHGPPFRTLSKSDFVHGGGRALVVARPPQELIGDRAGDRILIASATLDGCMYACGIFSFVMLDQRADIPLGIDRYRQSRLPKTGETCRLRLFYRAASAQGKIYDFTLLGEAGDAILQVEGYHTVQLTERSDVV